MTDPRTSELATEIAVVETDVRAELRLLGRALVAYGLIGIGLGLVGLVLAVGLVARLGSATGTLVPRLDALGTSLRSVATAMEDGAASSRVAASTIETTTPSIRGLAGTVDATVPTLRGMGGTLEGFDVFGARPLAAAGGRFTELADDLRNLGPQLRGLADGLAPNAATLRRTSDSMARVADELRAAGGIVGGGLYGWLVGLVGLLVVALLAWVLAPALGALVLGRWLLRRGDRLGRTGERVGPSGGR